MSETEQRDREHEHIDVSMVNKQAVSLPLILQALVMLGGLAAIYATGVANDRELNAKHEALGKRVEMLEADSRSFKSDLRTDLREIKDELRELRSEMSAKPHK